MPANFILHWIESKSGWNEIVVCGSFQLEPAGIPVVNMSGRSYAKDAMHHSHKIHNENYWSVTVVLRYNF